MWSAERRSREEHSCEVGCRLALRVRALSWHFMRARPRNSGRLPSTLPGICPTIHAEPPSTVVALCLTCVRELPHSQVSGVHWSDASVPEHAGRCSSRKDRKKEAPAPLPCPYCQQGTCRKPLRLTGVASLSLNADVPRMPLDHRKKTLHVSIRGTGHSERAACNFEHDMKAKSASVAKWHQLFDMRGVGTHAGFVKCTLDR